MGILNDVFDSVGEKIGRENWSGLRGVTRSHKWNSVLKTVSPVLFASDPIVALGVYRESSLTSKCWLC